MGKMTPDTREQEGVLAGTPDWQPPVTGTGTFSRLPRCPEFGLGEVDLAILGIPWDGLVTYRPGARFGPQAIRQASIACRSYSQAMKVDVFKNLKSVDAGDVDVSIFDFEETFSRIETRVAELQQAGAAVVSIGGDHSVLLPILRATSAKHRQLTLIHIDAHTDTSDTGGNPPHHHGTCIRDAIEEGLIKGERIFQIGIRGSFGDAEYLAYGEQSGINLLDMHDFHDPARKAEFTARLRETAGEGPCYLTFDIDGVDPAFAPGTGTPVPGGLSSFEAIDFLYDLRGLNFVGGDVVEVAPVYDIETQITSLLAASIVLQIAALVAIGKPLSKS